VRTSAASELRDRRSRAARWMWILISGLIERVLGLARWQPPADVEEASGGREPKLSPLGPTVRKGVAPGSGRRPPSGTANSSRVERARHSACVTRSQAEPFVPSTRKEDRVVERTRRFRHLLQGHFAPAAPLGGTLLQRAAVERDARGRTFRGDGRAGPPRARHPRVLSSAPSRGRRMTWLREDECVPESTRGDQFTSLMSPSLTR
jgi:hypothetical protein